MLKHRYRYEDKQHLVVIEDLKGTRLARRACASRDEAIAMRDGLFEGYAADLAAVDRHAIDVLDRGEQAGAEMERVVVSPAPAMSMAEIARRGAPVEKTGTGAGLGGDEPEAEQAESEADPASGDEVVGDEGDAAADPNEPGVA